jgi:protein SCO1
VGIINRRYATESFCSDCVRALKGPAKFIWPLRGLLNLIGQPFGFDNTIMYKLQRAPRRGQGELPEVVIYLNRITFMEALMMNRRYYRRWPVVILILFLMGGAMTFLHAQAASKANVGIDEKLGAQVALDAQLKDENGNIVTLRQLIDKPTILTLNYFRCAGICTPLLNGLQNSLNIIELEPGKQFQVITISFDPTDTPDIARQKRINYLGQMTRPFPPGAWRFLTGEAQNTKMVTDSVGFGFVSDGDQFIHAGAIMILTPQGKVSRYFYGISFLPADLKMAILEAARGLTNPTIARVLSFCYSYDPQQDAYVFSITRVVGAVMLIIVGIFVILLIRERIKAKKRDSAKTP